MAATSSFTAARVRVLTSGSDRSAPQVMQKRLPSGSGVRQKAQFTGPSAGAWHGRDVHLGAPCGLGVGSRIIGETKERAAGRIDDVDLRVAVLIADEGDLLPVGRPGRVEMAA